MNNDHDTHDLEHVWPPYGVQLAEPDTRTFPDRMLAWCGALEWRIEMLEQRAAMLSAENEALRKRVADIAALRRRVRRLEAAEVHP